MGHAFRHPLGGHLRAGEGQIDQFGPPASTAQPLDQPKIGAAAEGGFEGEALTSLETGVQLAEKDAAGGHQLSLDCQGSEAGCDRIGIDEMSATHHQRQEP